MHESSEYVLYYLTEANERQAEKIIRAKELLIKLREELHRQEEFGNDMVNQMITLEEEALEKDRTIQAYIEDVADKNQEIIELTRANARLTAMNRMQEVQLRDYQYHPRRHLPRWIRESDNEYRRIRRRLDYVPETEEGTTTEEELDTIDLTQRE